ncbi:MAG: rod shape-determining protein MreC [Bacteroidales bacterium]|nr:rod shape-determining protein MreC [Bacteroidales bacterium]
MRNLLHFLVKYSNIITFILLQGLAFSFIFSGFNYHNTRLIKGVRGITTGIEMRLGRLNSYLRLRDINDKLSAENAELKNRLQRMIREEDLFFLSVRDTLLNQEYQYTNAEVIANSVNRQKNYLTINKGRKHGIETGMAVASPEGIAGIITGVSDNYSVAISLLNLDFRVSARIKSNDYFGSLSWDGRRPEYAILSEIPQHVVINEGDTVETTGFSAIFPEGITIGTIKNFSKSGSDFYNIEVALSTDFRRLRYVYIIGNLRKKEREELESSVQ